MTRLGMDVDVVEGLGRQLKGQAHQLQGVVTQIESLVNQSSTAWDGKDSQDFRQWWLGEHKPKLVSLQPVSYTHLDVYKRQIHGGPCHVYGLDFSSRGLAMLEDLPHVGSIVAGHDHERVVRLLRWLRAVSYTHLDVYKRQVLGGRVVVGDRRTDDGRSRGGRSPARASVDRRRSRCGA